MRVPLIYKHQPLLGLDIGSRTVKFVQLGSGGTKVLGYGYANLSADALTEGIIVDPKTIAQALKPALLHPFAGRINAKRVVLSLPVAKVFTRILQLPPMSAADLEQAVKFETEQYVPVPMNDLYIDYETVKASAEAAKQHTNVLMVAAPRAIVDSYVKLFDVLGLEVEALETSLAAITRAMISATRSQRTTLVVDFGSKSADLAIYDQVIRLTGTIPIGGDSLTEAMVKGLAINVDQAQAIKIKFGIGDSDMRPKVLGAIEAQLATVVAEIKKVVKYYQDRSEAKSPVETMILTGGSASMPGLVDYLYKALDIPIIVGNPWLNLATGQLPKLDKLEAPMYTTAIGLALRGAQQ
ncbi:MAG TPA: type IV pilus assembly protein PilM [Candidatus Saccharimonadales bacterium]|nr:type IV pilus assembly protein PilM [Candidatus Saccharimonadales bacterium]